MLKITDKALSVTIDTFTGDLTLRYIYPIKKAHLAEYQEVAQAYNITIDTCRNKTRAIFVITAPSNVAFTTFRIIQKQLMILSRQCKVTQLNKEIANLQQ